MGEIRFVGTGETRGYPYLVCKKKVFHSVVAIGSVGLVAHCMLGVAYEMRCPSFSHSLILFWFRKGIHLQLG